jgi:hypothetical protein
MPEFGLRLEYRPYVCTFCGREKEIQTNHTDVCFDHCPGCSWKGMQDAAGEWHLPGYRAFRYASDDKSSGLELNVLEAADRLLEDPKMVRVTGAAPVTSSV